MIINWLHKYIINLFYTPIPPFPNPTPDNTDPSPKPPTPPEPYSQLVLQLLDSHNIYREQYKKPALKLNSKLVATATKHAQWMNDVGRMSHTGKNRSSHFERIAAEGYRASSTAENVAWGQHTVEEVMDAWMHSRGHKANILSNNIECGFGMVGNYWCSVFAKPVN